MQILKYVIVKVNFWRKINIKSRLNVLLLLSGLLYANISYSEAVESIYTKLALDASCPTVMQDEESGSSVNRCKGVAAYNVLVVYSDDRMSATVEAPDQRDYPLKLWSWVSQSFSSLGDTAEWRVTNRGGKQIPFALILRFNAEDPETGKPISYLTVSKITPSEICLTQIIPPLKDANVQARIAANEAPITPCYSGQPNPPLFPPNTPVLTKPPLPSLVPPHTDTETYHSKNWKIHIPTPEREAILAYATQISQQDRFNEQGQKIRSSAVLLRDRENVHKYNRRDTGDSSDPLNRIEEGRILFSRLLNERWDVSLETEEAIINGTYLGRPIDPLIYVYVYSSGISIYGEGIDGDCGCDCATAPDC